MGGSRGSIMDEGPCPRPPRLERLHRKGEHRCTTEGAMSVEVPMLRHDEQTRLGELRPTFSAGFSPLLGTGAALRVSVVARVALARCRVGAANRRHGSLLLNLGSIAF